jgi:hypothetical protein
MSTLRRHRRWLVPWLAAAFLCVQWLTVAHACPQWRSAAAVEPAVEQALPQTADLSAMADCEMHGNAASGTVPPQLLCKAHCQAGEQSVNSHAGALDAPPAAMLVTAIVPALDVAARTLPEAVRDTAARAAGPPRGAPPLYLSLLALRN